MGFSLITKVDEAEGSPSQDGVKLQNGSARTSLGVHSECTRSSLKRALLEQRKSIDQRKPSGCAITRFSLPPV